MDNNIITAICVCMVLWFLLGFFTRGVIDDNQMTKRIIAVGYGTFDKSGKTVYNNPNVKFIITGKE